MHTVTSQVETVTVYRRGARVTRLAEIPQPAQGWPDQLRLTDLPLTLLDNTLSARLEFPQGGGGLVARELRVELQSQQTDSSAPPQMSQLRHQIGLLQCQLERLESDIAKMEKLEPGQLVLRATQPPQGFPLQARRAVVQLRQKTLAAWLPRRTQLRERIEELVRQVRQASFEVQPARLELSKSVVLNLRARTDAQASQLRLLLSYQVQGACWAPGYSLRFDRDYSLADLELRALVCQSSGEDWNGVNLSVSTAEPESWTELPQLASRRLGRRQDSRTLGWRPLPPNSEALLADYDGVPLRPRGIPIDFGEPPAYLSDRQVAAVAMMTLDPQVSAMFFKALQPSQVQAVTLEISKLPHISPEERREAARYLVGKVDSLEALACADSDRLLQRLVQLLGSHRAARATRPEAKPVLYSLSSGRCSDIADLLCDRSGRSASVLECRVAPLVPKRAPRRSRGQDQGELSPDQLAFDLLYLPGAEESERGRLQPQSPIEASLKRWQNAEQAAQARTVLAEALRQGEQAAYKSPPPGHRAPEAVKSQDWLYPGEARVSVSSDCHFHSVPLLRRQLPSALHWLVVPKVTSDVFRQVELECPGDLALLAGPVDLFVGSDYLACVELPSVAAGESFPLDMGVETAVRVVRKATFQEQTTGMMGGTLQLRHEVQIEAHNYLGRQVRLQVREPLPQAAEGSDCKVRMDSQWEALGEGKGQFCWLALAPGQRAGCHFSYTIEMSNRLELVGGNRREK